MLEQFEQYGLFGLILGGLLLLIGLIGLILAAFRHSTGWGLAVLFVPVLGPLGFICCHFRKAARALVVLAAGGLVIGATYGINHYVTHHIDLGPRDKIVDGERHLTLTGWDKNDYSVIATKPDTIVLQMANADVTDQALEHLRGLVKLRELDLNDTQVGDHGLLVLKELPELKILRLRGTKLTEQGFHEHLANKESLLELDVRETAVSSKTMREWKAKRKDERKYLK